MKKQPIDRFKTRYDVDSNGCHVWRSGLRNGGYGIFDVFGTSWKAHNFAYVCAKGGIPEGLVLDHLCRNRACVNPDHLEPVTPGENVRRGQAAKLNRAQVDEIRALYATGNMSCRELAKKYDVHHATIAKIVSNKSWKEEP